MFRFGVVAACVMLLGLATASAASGATQVSIAGEEFRINGAPTYQGTTVEGLLLNSRMVNSIFDDENSSTRSMWEYPDTGQWSAERNVTEFIAALPLYASKGLNAVTASLQGGNPVPGCSCDASHNWITSAYTSTGALKSAWMSRLDRVLTAADQHGIVVILTLFYHGQDQRIADEASLTRATDNVVDWLLAEGHHNVLVEIAGESNHGLTSHAIVRDRVHDLIARVQQRSGGQLAASTGFTGGFVPNEQVIGQSDFVILHGNGQTPSSIGGMVDTVRSRSSWAADPKPIVFTEDSTNLNNFAAVVAQGASWGFHDKGGFQIPPAVWGINSSQKREFFDRVESYAGSIAAPRLVFTPSSLSVPVDQGAAPLTRTVALASSTGASTAYTVVDDAAWLSASPAGGSTPVNLTLAIDPTGLAPGTYTGNVRATASGHVDGTLRVSLIVSDPAGDAYSLRVSERSDRADSVPLDGETVGGDIFVFTAPDTNVDSVAFHVDDPDRSGPAVRTEGNGPYDLAGGEIAIANPYDTERLSEGPHTVTATIRKLGGAIVVVHATFEVDNEMPALSFTPTTLAVSTPAGGPVVSRSVNLAGDEGTTPDYGATSHAPWLSVSPAAGVAPAALTVQADPAGLAAGTYTGRITATSEDFAPAVLTVTFTVGSPPSGSGFRLMTSDVATRADPRELDSATLRGDAYVFVPEDSRISEVHFDLDGAPERTERNAPWDFAGGASGSPTANPWDTTDESAGAHSITARIRLTNGTTQSVTANFTIAHALPPDQIHLAWLGDPSTTLTVVWRTRGTSGPTSLEYRRAGTTAWQTAAGGLRASGTEGTLREVTITGLTPSTAYEYRVPGDEGLTSAVHTARTAPPPGPADFDAVYFADTGLIGRTDGLAAGTAAVIQAIDALDPLLLLAGGDYAYFSTDKRYGTLENTIDAWFNQEQPITTEAPMMPTYGNHEALLGEGYDNWAQRFPTPDGLDGRRYYSFDVGDVHFVSIFAVENTAGLSSAALNWIDSDIQSARARGMRWIMPFLHVSPFADGTNHPSNLALREQLGPIFERHGVQVALTSHDQAYERTYPLADIGDTDTPTSTSTTCYGPADGVTFVKASPAGKHSNISGHFSPFAHSTPPHWTAHRDNTAHFFARVRVFAEGILRVDAYAVPDGGGAPAIRDTFEYRLAGCGPEPDATPPPPPTATPPAGRYTSAQSVSLASEPGAAIRYTLDGSTPTPLSPLYTGPIAVPDDTTIRAIAIDGSDNVSAVTTHAYVIEPSSSTGYAAAIAATPGLVAHWRLDETSGPTAADALGRNPGAFQNGVVLGQAGALLNDSANRSARFDGSDDQVRVADHATLDTGDHFTLEAWVLRRTASSSKVYRVLSKGDGNYAFGFTNNFIALRRQAFGDVVRSRSTLTDTAGWHHIVVTKTGAIVRLYLDGADVTDPATIPSPVPAMANTAADLFVGRASNATAGFPGNVDEAAIYDRALTAAEVLEHYRASGR